MLTKHKEWIDKDKRSRVVVPLSLLFLVVFTVYQHILCLLLPGEIPKSTRIKAMIASYLTIAVLYYLWQRAEADARHLRAELNQQTRELMDMHEHRHDLLNELTLALMYLQSGDMEKGQQCLRYAASHVSNGVSKHGLPEDAWMEMINLKQKQAIERGITFHLHLSYAALENPRQSHLLARLLGNLLDNALEAAAESSKPFVVVACRHGTGYRKLVVGNNGASIPPELIEQVKRPGFSTRDGKRGYGLAISERLAVEMGGYLDIKSEPHKEWTEVSIVMPTPNRAGSKESLSQKGAS